MQEIKAYLDWLRDPPFCLAFQGTTGTAVATATSVAVGMDGESIDTNGMHSTTTNNSRIVLNELGWWQINASVGFPGNATGDRMATLQTNGPNLVGRQVILAPSATNPVVLQVAAFVSVASITDYVELLAYQNSGGSLTTQPVGARTWMSARWIHS